VHKHATESTVVNGVKLRVAKQRLKRSFDLSDELATQSGALALVPMFGVAQISLGAWSNYETPFHAAITSSTEI
jgi:hypothetical protein